MRKLFCLLFTVAALVGVVAPALASTSDDTAAPSPASTPAAPPGTELVSRRTERSATFTTGDPDEVEVRFYAGPTFFEDDDGDWRKIDSKLVDNGEGGVQIRANDFDLDLASKASADQIARFELDENHSVGFGLDGAVAGEVSRTGATQTMANVADDTSLRLKAIPTGLKFDIVLQSADAETSYLLPLATKNLTPRIDADGGVAFLDEAGESRLSIPHGYMDDSARDASGEGAHSDGVTYSLVAVGDGATALQVDLDNAWISDPARVFPVVVDPDITVTVPVAGDDTYAQSPHNNDFSTDTELKVGYCAASNCNTQGGQTLKARSFMHFDLSSLAGQTLTGASLKLYEHHSYGCDTTQTVNAYRVASGSFPGYLTWAGPALGDLLGGKAFAHGNTCAADWDAIPLNKDVISQMANGQVENRGIAIAAANETTNAGWKKFHSAQGANPPRLVVTTPSNRTPTGSLDGAAGGQGRVHLTGWAWDPDSPGQSINVAVYFSNNFTNPDQWYLANAQRTDVPPVVPGTSNNQGFDLWIERAPGTYTICVYGIDTAGGTNSTIGCGTATITAPAVPTAPRTPAATRDDTGGATVTWVKPANDGGRSVSQYTVRAWTQNPNLTWSDSGKQKTCPVTPTNPCTSTTFTNLTVGVPHAFVISATNAVGTGPTVTSPVVTPATKPAAPAPATASQNGTTATIDWTVPAANGSPITKFVVGAFDKDTGAYAGLSSTENCSACTTTTVGGLDQSKSYVFQVWAYNSIGASSPAQTNPVPTAPSKPLNARQKVYGDELLDFVYAGTNVQWDRPAADGGRTISKYTVTATNTQNAANSVSVDCTGACVTKRELRFEGLTPTNSYQFTVKALNAVGWSLPSDSSAALTANPISVLAPSNLNATRGDRSATLTWAKPLLAAEDFTKYEAQVYDASTDEPIGDPINLGLANHSCNAGTVAKPCAVVPGLRNGREVYFTLRTIDTVPLTTIRVPSLESMPSNSVTPAGNPFAPSNAVASPGDKSVHLTWVAAGEQPDGSPGDNGAPVTYTVKLLLKSDNTEAGTVTTTETFADFGSLANGTTYYATVIASNVVGDSPQIRSNDVTPAGKPSKPTDVHATAGDQSATVTWGAAAANGADVTYQVSARRASDDVEVATKNAGTSLSTQVTGLANGTRVYFVVTAANTAGTNESDRSNVVTPGTNPDRPTGVVATINADGVPVVSWTAPANNGEPITSYTVTADNGKKVEVPGQSTATTFPGLRTTRGYSFRVTAWNAFGESAVSDPSGSVTPTMVPDAPTNVSVVENGAMATVNWIASVEHGAPVTSYEVTALPTSGLPPTIKNAPREATSLYFDNLTEQEYVFSIVALSDVGPSARAFANGPVDPPVLVALGDSFSSGEGNTPFLPEGENGGCNRSMRAYGPTFAGARFNLVFPACSGGLIRNIDDVDQNGTYAPKEQFPGDTAGGQITAIPANANMVTLTIGGNDADFADILTDCIKTGAKNALQPFFKEYCEDHHPDAAENADALRPLLQRLYTRIGAKAPHAEIFVLGYPRLLTNENRNQFCAGDLGIEASDKAWTSDMVDHMNGVILNAVNDANESGAAQGRVHFVDVSPHIAGHEVCTADAWINGITYTGGFSSEGFKGSFHPQAAAHAKEAELLKQIAVLRNPTVTSVTPTSGPAAPSVCSSNPVTIRGTNFAPGARVYFGGLESANVDYVSRTELRATPPSQAPQSVTVTVKTNRGLYWGSSPSGPQTQFDYVADTIPPATQAATNPAPNAAGWVNKNPTVTMTSTDPTCPADVASITYSATPAGSDGGETIPERTVPGNSASFQVTTEGSTLVTFSAIDSSGNREQTKQLLVKLDRTAPTNLSVSPDRPTDHNGYYNHPFTATWQAQDSLSGIAPGGCTTTTYTGPDSSAGQLNGTCSDVAGNTTTALGFAFKYDATAPTGVHGTTSRAPDSNGWYNHAVTVSFDGDDTTSGIDNCTSTTYAGPDAADVSIAGSCTDVAGNTTNASLDHLYYDGTKATTTIDGLAVQAISAGTPMTGTSDDNLSGVAAVTVTFTDSSGLRDPVIRTATCTSGCATLHATWSVDTTGLQPGVYATRARTTDVAGNPGDPSELVVTLTVS